MVSPTPHQLRFVDHLCKLGARDSPDRAALAAMRRAARGRPGANAEIHRYVAPWIPEDMRDREVEGYYLVAALFATHPENRPTDSERPWRTNFGASFSELRSRGNDSAERRFVALLNSHREDLPNHLRHAVSLLRTHGVAVDWAQLIQDLRYWDHPDRFVQREWARSFWAPARDPQPTAS